MPQLTIERHGAVAICTITNPPDGYMDGGTVPELNAATKELAADPGVRAVVFTGGVPGVFIRHYSVHELEALSRRMREQGVTVDTTRPIPERELDAVFLLIEEMPKPCIAAMNGTAMGGEFELALCCDIRIGEEGPYWYGHRSADGPVASGTPAVRAELPGSDRSRRSARTFPRRVASPSVIRTSSMNRSPIARITGGS
jgi:enoyl-CoA hydratase